MPENPTPYEPEADVPVVPIEGVTDQRVLDVAAAGAEFKTLIRDRLPGSPHVELAARYVDLAVQAAHGAAQETPPAATGRPREQPEAPGPRPTAEERGRHRSASPRTGKQANAG